MSNVPPEDDATASRLRQQLDAELSPIQITPTARTRFLRGVGSSGESAHPARRARWSPRKARPAGEVMFGSRVQVSRVYNPDGSVGFQLVSRRQGADSVERDSVERDSAPMGRGAPGRVVLRGVRGVQVGDRNLQVDEYRVKVNARVDLNEALQRGAVVKALQALSRDPDDVGLRDAAVRALRSAGRPGGRTSFDLSSMRLEGGGLFVLRNQGVQYGNGNRQRNTFAYVVSPDLSATELLAGNADLARALVDTVCPPGARSGRCHELQRRLGAAIDSARAAIAHPARAHALSFAAPPTGGVLRVDQADGVQVGRGNRQRHVHRFTRGHIQALSTPPPTLGAVLDAILTTITGETNWRTSTAKAPEPSAPAPQTKPRSPSGPVDSDTAGSVKRDAETKPSDDADRPSGQRRDPVPRAPVRSVRNDGSPGGLPPMDMGPDEGSKREHSARPSPQPERRQRRASNPASGPPSTEEPTASRATPEDYWRDGRTPPGRLGDPNWRPSSAPGRSSQHPAPDAEEPSLPPVPGNPATNWSQGLVSGPGDAAGRRGRRDARRSSVGVGSVPDLEGGHDSGQGRVVGEFGPTPEDPAARADPDGPECNPGVGGP